MPLTPELPPSIMPPITAMLRSFNPVCGTELMLKVRVGSMNPQKPPETVVTELEFSAEFN
jgi:hypothetical protein